MVPSASHPWQAVNSSFYRSPWIVVNAASSSLISATVAF